MALQEAEMLKDIMENICHPNIMHIEKVFQVGSKFYLVFPLCTGGELYEAVIRRGHFTEHDAAILTRDLISGINALHRHDILHLDIKPENILFDCHGEDAKIKITDFGLSKVYNGDMQNIPMPTQEELNKKIVDFFESGVLNRDKLRGTIGYMSPELILTGHCSKATDVFAAGVVTYILLCGHPPFQSKSNREVLERTARGQVSGGIACELYIFIYRESRYRQESNVFVACLFVCSLLCLLYLSSNLTYLSLLSNLIFFIHQLFYLPFRTRHP